MTTEASQSVEPMVYFTTQMAVHLTRILAANGVDDRLKSAIRQTLAQGREQFSRDYHNDLEGLAKVFASAVDGGVEDRAKIGI